MMRNPLFRYRLPSFTVARAWQNDVYAGNPNVTLAQLNAIGGQLSAAAHKGDGGFFGGLTSSIMDAAITLSGARVITPFVKKTSIEVIHASNRVVKAVITHTPGFHALPKDLQRVILQITQVPTNMHELEKNYQVLQRFYFSKAKYIDPMANQIYKHELRQDKISVVQAALQAAEADYKIHPTAAKYAFIQQLMAELAALSAEEAHFMHNMKVFATVAAIALTVFTFGAGTPVASAAYVSFANMVGTATAQMISMAANMVLSAVKKIGTVSEQAYAQLAYTLGVMAKFPPPKSLTKPVDQMRWSLMAAANGNAPATATVQAKKESSLFPLVSVGLTLLNFL